MDTELIGGVVIIVFVVLIIFLIRSADKKLNNRIKSEKHETVYNVENKKGELGYIGLVLRNSLNCNNFLKKIKPLGYKWESEDKWGIILSGRFGKLALQVGKDKNISTCQFMDFDLKSTSIVVNKEVVIDIKPIPMETKIEDNEIDFYTEDIGKDSTSESFYVCENCKSLNFEYDKYYDETTCLNCGRIDKGKFAPYDKKQLYYNECRKLFFKHINQQLDKTKSLQLEEAFIQGVENTLKDNIDDIINKIVDFEPLADNLTNYAYKNFTNGIYMIVTILPWSRSKAIDELSHRSKEEPFGYIDMMNNIFINDWPSKSLTHFFHILICLGNNNFDVHTAMGEYGGSPNAHREFLVLPVELLNEEENKIICGIHNNIDIA